ncbi:MAG: glycoside hydrolase family 2 TIM barrel-domain containing protein, partial [Victivallales bacterium]|nr:glycoside hydrolase family 2 TIM barrel-domain containing protein [Victivallales bacterium]
LDYYNDVFLESDTAQKRLTAAMPDNIQGASVKITSMNGEIVRLPIISRLAFSDNMIKVIYNAETLDMWTPAEPIRYCLDTGGRKICFGYGDITTRSNKIFVNGKPFYFRGYIRGIVAHEHPNLTGKPKRDFYRKNIIQAKKYGFNLVRFHSTVPDMEFIDAADELGIFVHVELGFCYEYDAAGNKLGIAMDADKWRELIIRLRNHPSVAIFCLGNEMHNSGSVPEVHDMYRIARELAPHKLIMNNAGWGEFDRTSADVFTQHVAYYFPFKRHREMFNQDFCWEMNGSVRKYPLTEQATFPGGEASIRRELNPVRPVLAHECVHYIDIPDYAALNDEFDAFCREAGEDCLLRNNISKPRYLTELPKLIAAKGLTEKLPDYIEASRQFKKAAVKVYLEQLRFSGKFCGYEMLQFADCFKYENKNGIVDSFDNDKFIDAAWFRSFNSDRALLADFPKENFYSGEEFKVGVYLSNYGFAEDEPCTLKIYVSQAGEPETMIYSGEYLIPVEGLSRLVELKLKPGCKNGKTAAYKLKAELANSRETWSNQWEFRVYPEALLKTRPETRVSTARLKNFLSVRSKHAEQASDLVFTDVLDDSVFNDLEAGKTVILNYHRDRNADQYYFPGALDRFKPCIWDRGNNLGGVVNPSFFQDAMGGGRYFGLNYYYLVEAGYKINLDHFPVPVNELIWGVDKPVRDRMKCLNQGIKDFLPDDMFRNFSYLFSVNAGNGLLVVCTFNFSQADSDPAVANVLCELINQVPELKTACTIKLPELKNYLEQTTRNGVVREDIMNYFWELDNKPVEDTLFWEDAQVDLRKIDY